VGPQYTSWLLQILLPTVVVFVAAALRCAQLLAHGLGPTDGHRPNVRESLQNELGFRLSEQKESRYSRG